MKTIIKRWRSESPKLFKVLTSIFISAGAIGAAILAMEGTVPGYASAAAPHLIVAGIVGGAISKLTVKDANVL